MGKILWQDIPPWVVSPLVDSHGPGGAAIL